MVDTYPLNPVLSYKFRMDVNGIGQLCARKITGLEEESSVATYREGCDDDVPRTYPIRVSYPVVTVERGVTMDSTQFQAWRDEVKKTPNTARKTVVIQLHNKKGEPVRTYTLYKAWPNKITYGDLDADSDEVYIETLELTHEGMDVEHHAVVTP